MRTDITNTNERGQTMTEFTLILPILCLLLFGVIQFGIVFNNYVTVTDAARAGARKAVVSRTAMSPSAITENAVRSSAATLDQSKLAVTVATSWTQGTDVTVTAAYPYEISLLGLIVKSGTLHASTTERLE
jgi:Flp pilus assembly protein TadG